MNKTRRMVFGLIFAGAAALAAPLTAGNFSTLVFAASDPEAIVMVEEKAGLDAGQMRFEPLDPALPKLVGKSFLLDKDVWFGRLKTANAELQDYSLPSFFKGFSRFSAIKRPAGVYAFTEHIMTTGPKEGRQCQIHAMPVFRFKPGVANLVPNSTLADGGFSDFIDRGFVLFSQKVPEEARRRGVRDPLADAQRVLDERKGIKARVEYAEFLGFVAWQNSKGELSGCYRSKNLVWVTPEMARQAVGKD